MVSCGSRDHRRGLEGHVRRSGQGAGREGQRMGTRLYQGPWVECFRVLRLRPDRLVQTPKSGVLVNSTGVLQGRGYGRQG